MSYIDNLHDIVRRLTSLKRVYQSYELVIERLLQETQEFFPVGYSLLLQPSAASRFARLRYHVIPLAINGIEDCKLEAQGLISLVIRSSRQAYSFYITYEIMI